MARVWGRRLVGIALGFFVFILVLFVTDFGVNRLAVFGSLHFPDKDGYPLVSGWRELWTRLQWAYPAAVAICIMYAFWDSWPTARMRFAVYLLVFAFIAPLTFINYVYADQIIDVRVQFAFDIFTALIAYMIVLNLRALRPKSYDGKAIQVFSVFLVSAVGIAVPLFYAGVFGLVAVGWIDHKDAQAIGKETSTHIAGAVGGLSPLLTALDGLGGRSSQQIDPLDWMVARPAQARWQFTLHYTRLTRLST
jgi:hypothetical protein